jgi:hypothetical protein
LPTSGSFDSGGDVTQTSGLPTSSNASEEETPEA